MSDTVFCSTYLKAQKRAIDLPVDDKGYRQMVIGGLDVYNDIGELYPATEHAVGIFASNSDFMKKVNKSYLRGEATHPVRMPGEDADAFLSRALGIDLKNVTHHFNRVWLEPGKDEHGRSILLTMGSFKPSGMKGPAFKMMCENAEENIAMSIRCFTNPVRMPNGEMGKELRIPVTWDLVNQPGIDNANSFDSLLSMSAEAAKVKLGNIPKLDHDNITFAHNESDIIVTPQLLDMASENSMQMAGFEDANATARMVRTELGWQKVQVIPTYDSTHWL